MAKYEKSFTPKRANTASAALYSHLADGQPHQVEDTIVAVTQALAAEQSAAAVMDSVVADDRQLRSVARNALYVARRSGRIEQRDGRVVLDASIAEAWNQYREGDSTDSNAAEINVSVA